MELEIEEHGVEDEAVVTDDLSDSSSDGISDEKVTEFLDGVFSLWHKTNDAADDSAENSTIFLRSAQTQAINDSLREELMRRERELMMADVRIKSLENSRDHHAEIRAEELAEQKMEVERAELLACASKYRSEALKLRSIVTSYEADLGGVKEIEDQLRRSQDETEKMRRIMVAAEDEMRKTKQELNLVGELLVQKEEEVTKIKEASSEEIECLKQQIEEGASRNSELEKHLESGSEECSRLRTENVKLKNEMKVIQQEQNTTKVCTTADEENTGTNFAQDITDTINSLTSAIASMAGRLDAHDDILNQRQISSQQVSASALPVNVSRSEESDTDKTWSETQGSLQNNSLTQQRKQPQTTLEEINRFASLRFSANNPITAPQDVNKLVPGPRNYNDVVAKGSETLIFSTSITKGINKKEFNEHFEGDGTVSFRRFHGGLARHIKHYLWVHLSEVQPESVIIQTGGNDLLTPRSNPVPVADIAKHIIDSGLICREYGTKNILISSVPTRRAQYMQVRCNELNRILEEQCKTHGFIFIDNSNIGTSCLQNDGVHLLNEGSAVLARNYLFSLNSLVWGNIYNPNG